METPQPNTSLRRIAQIIAYCFHPLLMPTIGVVILLNTNSYINYTLSYELKRAILILVATNTFAMPLFITLLMLNRKWISSLTMETQQERFIPYFLTAIFYLIAYYLLKQVPIPPILHHFIAGSTLAVLVSWVINIKWKISAHAVGMGGLLGLLLYASVGLEIYTTPYFILAVLAAGLVGFSRLFLNAHSSSQVYSGFVVGFLCQMAVFFYG